MAITDKHFIDWESDVFGFGYGTGEEPVLQTLIRFFSLLNERGSYEYHVLESELGQPTTWLLINTLCHADIIEYGSSPRYGWLTEKGKLLRDFMKDKSLAVLCDLTSVDEGYAHCMPDICNCAPDPPCNNPLF